MSTSTDLTTISQATSGHSGTSLTTMDMAVLSMMSMQQAGQVLRTTVTEKTNEVMSQLQQIIEAQGKLLAEMQKKIERQEIQAREREDVSSARNAALAQQLSVVQKELATEKATNKAFRKKMKDWFKRHCHPNGAATTPRFQHGTKTVQQSNPNWHPFAAGRKNKLMSVEVPDYSDFNWTELEILDLEIERKGEGCLTQ